MSLPFRVCQARSGRPCYSGTPILYTHTLCPYAERAWLTLQEKLPADGEAPAFTLVHIDLAKKPSWFREVNPRGLVPAVEYPAGVVHTESIDICRWADAELDGPPLLPADPKLRAEVDRLIAGVDAFVSAGLDLMAGRTGRYWGIGGSQTPGQRAAFEAQLVPLDRALQRHGGPYLTGQHLTLADLVYYPFARRFDLGMQRFCGYDLRAVLGGGVGRWLEAMARRGSCATASADDGLLLHALEQHQSLDFFDYDTYTVFQLHPHNAKYLGGAAE